MCETDEGEKIKKSQVSENLLDCMGDLPTSKSRIQKRINY